MALILIVDDSAFQRGILNQIVTAAGHDVLEAEDGNAGLEIASSKKPDCILGCIRKCLKIYALW